MAELYLIAPTDAAAASFPGRLDTVLDSAGVSALLLPRAGHAENSYRVLVRTVVPLVRSRGVALLIEGSPGEVRMLGADGLHVTGGDDEVREALAALKPDFIVGALCDGTRHDAMTKGELGVDYVFFGPTSGSIDAGTRELARWWAETMEVPGVFSDPQAGLSGGDAAAEGCDFLAVGQQVWAAGT